MATEVGGALLEVLVAPVSSYLPMDPVDSALDAVARYFAELGGIAGAKRGWPEHPEDLDLRGGPVVTVTLVDETREPVPPAPMDTTPVLWRTGELELAVMLDVWAAYRAQRDEAARVIERGLHNALPWRHGLLLKSTGYYSRPLSAEATSGRNTDEDQAATVGEWRRTWMLKVRSDLVAEVPLPTQDVITLRPTVGGTTDPDHDIP